MVVKYGKSYLFNKNREELGSYSFYNFFSCLSLNDTKVKYD